ncbi:MAG: glycosyltransferase family 2 protein [Verrucomicrobia bacterium]|nr:glycosyltransferase family 2 protein [Verrucomicrobiota bacterium]
MSSHPPDLSVIVPVFNRGDLIRYTLESVRQASAGLNVETIIVDDGSATPVADDLRRLGLSFTQIVRQENRGLLFARLAGFAHATGRYTVFLDSDDLVSPEKFHRQITALDTAGAEVSYTDTARVVLEGAFAALQPTANAPELATSDAAQFFITVQPAPHSPVFRTDYLRAIVARAIFPPSPLYNSVAEIWFYHIAAPFPARIVHVAGPHTIVGLHPGARLTSHWEKLGVASLAVMEAFARHCPAGPDFTHARRLVGEKAFGGWRRLPPDFSPEFGERMLAIWRQMPRGQVSALGGGGFGLAARLLGPVAAGRLFRRWQNVPYDSCRSLPDAEFQRLLGALPPP